MWLSSDHIFEQCSENIINQCCHFNKSRTTDSGTSFLLLRFSKKVWNLICFVLLFWQRFLILTTGLKRKSYSISMEWMNEMVFPNLTPFSGNLQSHRTSTWWHWRLTEEEWTLIYRLISGWSTRSLSGSQTIEDSHPMSCLPL